MDDHRFHMILDRMGYCRRGYRKVRKGVKRRLDRHMVQTGSRNIEAYLERLHGSADEMETFRRLMTVPISRLFRDKPLWDNLQASVLPTLVKRFGAPLDIWSAGCACGEEVYSVKMLWEDAGLGTPPRILATDLLPDRIARARSGIYPRSSMREVPLDLLARWFDPLKGGRHYRARDGLRVGIRWQVKDMDENQEGVPFHLIFLRNNLLTYEANPRRWQVFETIRRQLLPGGFLVIGARETLGDDTERFVRRFPLVFEYSNQIKDCQ